jgi:hypothetical protein
MPQEALILLGPWSVLPVRAKSVTRRADGPDTCSLFYETTSATSPVLRGQAISEFPGLIADSVTSERNAGIWEHRITGAGILNGVAKTLRGSPAIDYSATDWDTAEVSIISTNPNLITEGSAGSFGGTTVCLSVRRQTLSTGVYQYNARYAGIIRPKSRQRVLQTNGQTVGGDSFVVNLPGGWTQPQRGDAQLPKLSVIDIYIATSPPPTGSLPGNLTPPNAPPVKIISVTPGPNSSRHWPGGWHLAAVEGEQLLNAGLWKNRWIYEYQYGITP